MRILNKEITIFDFLPLIFLRVFRRYLAKEPLWKAWQKKAVPVLLYIGPDFKSYSQFGEDVFLSTLFRNKTNGTFVDIGANHPTELNNTYKFYLEGWRGVNIEPGEKMFNLLQECRSEDINVRIGVGKTKGRAVFYEMDVDSVSTFNKNEANNKQYQNKLSAKPKLKF